jgi:hypothetical protein
MMREPTLQPERSKSKEEQFLERFPYKELKEKLENIIERLGNAGLTSDAEIVRKVFPRLEAWIKRLIEEKEFLERINKREITVEQMRYVNSWLLDTDIPVTVEIGKGGGWTYKPGAGGAWFGPEDAPKYTEGGERAKRVHERGEEIINYSFSLEGASIFLQALGIVGENQGLEEIPGLCPDMVERGTGNYRVVRDIEGLPGVKIVIHSYWSPPLPARKK